jgi:hypothetical protein
MGSLTTSILEHWLCAAIVAVTGAAEAVPTPVGSATPLSSKQQQALPHTTEAAEATITVHLASGRTFEAALDARTSAAELWLRFNRAGAELLRPIDWDRIVSAEVAGKTLSGEELHRLVIQVRQEIPAQLAAPPQKTHIVMVGQPIIAEPFAKPPTPPIKPRRVVSVAIDARAGRWDENVEPDGLVVHVYPLDADGAVVPVRGTLNVDLKAERQDQYRLRDPFLDAGQWTEVVRPEDIGPSGGIYRCRFQNIHPEFKPPESNRRVAWRGAVHATLAVPGQGTFEATDDMAILRPHSSVRDHLEAITRHGDFPGYRYFSNERTDDGRR